MDPELARRDLAPALRRARQALDPAEPEHIAGALEVLAETLAVEMPEGDALLAYIGLLQEIPQRALKQGFTDLLKTFSYHRMPKPAELHIACRGAEAELRFWHQALERAVALLDKEP